MDEQRSPYGLIYFKANLNLLCGQASCFRGYKTVSRPRIRGLTPGVMALSRWQDALWSSSVRGVRASDVITDAGRFADFVLGKDLLLLHSLRPVRWVTYVTTWRERHLQQRVRTVYDSRAVVTEVFTHPVVCSQRLAERRLVATHLTRDQPGMTSVASRALPLLFVSTLRVRERLFGFRLFI